MRLAHSLLETFSRALGCATRPLLDRFTRGSLPGLEGTAKLAGLEGTVEILRDRYGVPQVFASNERDLFFGQGYVHAQDRFFQMEIGRRAGHGRVSELLGESALELDRLSRTIGFSRISASEKSPPPEALQALEAYSAGVNAFLTNEPLPPELLLLRHVPEPWRPADTAAWSVVMAWSLSATWEAKLLHAAGEEGALDKEALHPLIDPGLGSSAGSNAWAVAPARSASGSAMIAGDPHLLLGIPSLWYEIGLYGGPYSVVGASLPGSPGVVIGHNENVAWSITAAMTDVQDLYVERFEKGDTQLYEHAGAWRKAEVREEEIPVRGRRDPVVHQVRTTLHGPIVSDSLGGDQGLALRWTIPEPVRLVAAGLAVNRARQGEELLAALQDWKTPNQNFVYAEKMGGIGWALAGSVPLRAYEVEDPVPGWSGEYEWESLVPFEDLPRCRDPEEGLIVSANEAPDAPIPGSYHPRYRRDRIEALLRATRRHTLETLRDVQADLYSAPAHALAGRLARLAPPPAVPEELRRELRAWDGQLLAESRPGAVARVTLEVLLRRMIRGLPSLGSPLPAGAESYLVGLVPNLLDELAKLHEEILQEALEEALAVLRKSLGPDPEGWSWGALHATNLRHPLGVVGMLRAFLNRGPYPSGGDAYTVRVAGFSAGRSSFGPVTTGPNYRFIVDTGDWDQGWSIIFPGQSGHPASTSYDNQIGLWHNVRYRPMVFGRKMAELSTKHRLVLKPEKQ